MTLFTEGAEGLVLFLPEGADSFCLVPYSVLRTEAPLLGTRLKRFEEDSSATEFDLDRSSVALLSPLTRTRSERNKNLEREEDFQG